MNGTSFIRDWKLLKVLQQSLHSIILDFRSSTMGTPGSIMSPVWTMDNILEKRSDSDRASIYSRSSGSASEYSVPRTCLMDKSFDSKRASPVACCTPTIPVKTGCQCWQQKNCCCRKKVFNGPYENYDVPKTPMPLIQVNCYFSKLI